MNFSGISKQKTLGKLLRFPLRLVPARAKMPIMQGAFKGKKWIAGSSDHGCWLGSYEIAKRRVFETHVTKGSIVFDVGAHVGYYTLLASVLAGAEGRIFAFEPLPQNLQFLREHVRINHLANVTVIDAAVAEKSGETRFQIGPSRSMGQLAAGGELPVRVVALDEQIAAGELPPPDFVKIDVEGAEGKVLAGARALLTTHHPTLFLETHGADIHQQCAQTLEEMGYKLRQVASNEILAQF